MSAKRALIVDDSRSARVFLTRILERYELQVDTAVSAEEAIEYLNRQRPDVIFLDHLMPGMDGLQALAAIKNDERTATIPVMMYTSQEGELYLSQARALGALGVFSKHIQPADVARALDQLRLLGADDKATAPAASAAVAYISATSPTAEVFAPNAGLSPIGAASAAASAAATASIAVAAGALTPEMRAQLEALLRDHDAEFRRFITESLQQHTARIVGEVRALVDEATVHGAAAAHVEVIQDITDHAATDHAAPGAVSHKQEPSLGTLAEAPSVARAVAPSAAAWPTPVATSRTPLYLSALAGGIAILAGVLWYRAGEPMSKVSAAPTAAPLPAPNGALKLETTASPDAALMVLAVPFGEMPFGGGRTEPIRALLERLVANKFRGVVEVRNYLGRYCLQGTGEAGTLAPGNTYYAKCEQVGNPVDAIAVTGRESVAFANMLAGKYSRSTSGFEVQLVTGSADSIVVPYPAMVDSLTAGEWNRAAAANNRVEVHMRALPGHTHD